MSKLSAAMRQLGCPREFRIQPPPFQDEWRSELAKIVAALRVFAAPAPPQAPSDRNQIGILCDMATGVWRLKYRMIDHVTERPKEQFRREYSHVESLWDVLSEAGVEIQDHTGQRIPPGLALKEIGRVPVPGLSHVRVQETIKPTIYFKGEHVQKGEVIVEVPA